MNRKKILSVILALILLLVCVSACQAASPPQKAGQEPAASQMGPEESDGQSAGFLRSGAYQRES